MKTIQLINQTNSNGALLNVQKKIKVYFSDMSPKNQKRVQEAIASKRADLKKKKAISV